MHSIQCRCSSEFPNKEIYYENFLRGNATNLLRYKFGKSSKELEPAIKTRMETDTTCKELCNT